MAHDDEKRKHHKKHPNKDIRYDEELRVSRHGYKRARERLGIPKDAVKRNAEKALKYGVERHEASGPFRRYLDALYYEYGTADNLRVFNRHVYILCGEVLVTVLKVPYKYVDVADASQRRKKRKLEEEYAENREHRHTKR